MPQLEPTRREIATRLLEVIVDWGLTPKDAAARAVEYTDALLAELAGTAEPEGNSTPTEPDTRPIPEEQCVVQLDGVRALFWPVEIGLGDFNRRFETSHDTIEVSTRPGSKDMTTIYVNDRFTPFDGMVIRTPGGSDAAS